MVFTFFDKYYRSLRWVESLFTLKRNDHSSNYVPNVKAQGHHCIYRLSSVTEACS